MCSQDRFVDKLDGQNLMFYNDNLGASPVTLLVKNLPAMQMTQV